MRLSLFKLSAPKNQPSGLIAIFVLICLMQTVYCQRLTLIDSASLQNIAVFNDDYDKAGNTSVANDAEKVFVWSGYSPFHAENCGYFDSAYREIPYIKRNRDLGQTFSWKNKTQTAVALILRLGFGSNVVRPQMCMASKFLCNFLK